MKINYEKLNIVGLVFLFVVILVGISFLALSVWNTCDYKIVKFTEGKIWTEYIVYEKNVLGGWGCWGNNPYRRYKTARDALGYLNANLQFTNNSNYTITFDTLGVR